MGAVKRVLIDVDAEPVECCDCDGHGTYIDTIDTPMDELQPREGYVTCGSCRGSGYSLPSEWS
jgi:DnaJ-class molecular chaperone